jgi:hypothetical protein
MKKYLSILAIGLGVMAASANAAPVEYTSAANWLTAIGAPDFTEAFDGALDADLLLSFGGGASLDEDGVGNLPNPLGSIGFEFNGGPIDAFGIDLDLSLGGDGSGILVQVNYDGGGNDFLILAPDGGGNFGFLGFTSFGTPVANVIFYTGNSSGIRERFTAANLQVRFAEEGEVDPGPIPEPATFGVMGLALVGLGAFRHFRRK